MQKKTVLITLGIASAALVVLKKIYSWHKQKRDMEEARKLYLLADFSVIAKLQQIIANDPMNFEARMILFAVTGTIGPFHKYATTEAEKQVSMIGLNTPEREYLAISEEFASNYLIQYCLLLFAHHFEIPNVIMVSTKRLLDCAPNKHYESIAWHYMYVAEASPEKALEYARTAVACAEHNNHSRVALFESKQEELDKLLTQFPQCYRATVETCYNLISDKKYNEALQMIAPYSNMATGLWVSLQALKGSHQYEKWFATIDNALANGIGNVNKLLGMKSTLLMRLGKFEDVISLAEQYAIPAVQANVGHAITLQKFTHYFENLEALQLPNMFSLDMQQAPGWKDIILVASHVYLMKNPCLLDHDTLVLTIYIAIDSPMESFLCSNAAIAYDFLLRHENKLAKLDFLFTIQNCDDPRAKYLELIRK